MAWQRTSSPSFRGSPSCSSSLETPASSTRERRLTSAKWGAISASIMSWKGVSAATGGRCASQRSWWIRSAACIAGRSVTIAGWRMRSQYKTKLREPSSPSWPFRWTRPRESDRSSNRHRRGKLTITSCGPRRMRPPTILTIARTVCSQRVSFSTKPWPSIRTTLGRTPHSQASICRCGCIAGTATVTGLPLSIGPTSARARVCD